MKVRIFFMSTLLSRAWLWLKRVIAVGTGRQLGSEVLMDESRNLMRGAQVRVLPGPLTILLPNHFLRFSLASCESRKVHITTTPGGGTKPGNPTRTPSCRCKTQRVFEKVWGVKRDRRTPPVVYWPRDISDIIPSNDGAFRWFPAVSYLKGIMNYDIIRTPCREALG